MRVQPHLRGAGGGQGAGATTHCRVVGLRALLPRSRAQLERDANLKVWWFEDVLKRCYIDFLASLEADLHETVCVAPVS